MELVYFYIVLGVIIIGYSYYAMSKYKARQLQETIDLINTVTPIHRGTSSERFLILMLLRYGINAGAIFHDLYIYKPDGRTSQIDIVVATKVGIIVFEVKDYGGWIYGKGSHQKWTQVLSFGREKHHFYNPILQNKSHITQLQRILKEDVPFFSVIVFFGDCELQDISFIPENTFVAKSYRVIDVVNNILKNNPIANYNNKRKVINTLKKTVTNGKKDKIEEKHINNIKDMLGKDRIFR